MASKKPVTVWVLMHGDQLCVYSTPSNSRRDVANCGNVWFGKRIHRVRFVAIDSLPEPLRAKVREACK